MSAAERTGALGFERLEPWLRGSVLVLAAVPRVYLALFEHGVYWPDEIYQTLEQGHRLAFGYGLVPWEFRDGVRSWVYPGALGGLLWIAAQVGVDTGLGLVRVARVAMVVLALLGINAGMKLASRLGDARAGLLAGVLMATHPLAVLFAHRCMTEMAGAALLTVAACWIAGRLPGRAAAAGAVAALAALVRYQNALVGALMLAWLVHARRPRDAARYLGAALLVGACGLALDWATWGSPVHSLVAYARFNLTDAAASTFGSASAWFYADTAWRTVGPALVVLAAGFALGARRAPWLAAAVAATAVVHALVAHKELRFLTPVLYLGLVVAALGLRAALAPAWLRWAGVPLVACVVAMAARAPAVTYGDTGLFRGQDVEDAAVWSAHGEVNLALAEVGRAGDLCGVAVVGFTSVFTGGYAYLHRDVPLGWGIGRPQEQAAANYLIARYGVDIPAGYRRTSLTSGVGVYRRDGGCEAPPADWSRVLPGSERMGLNPTEPAAGGTS